MHSCFSISCYSKEVENCIMDTITILDTHVCANNPYWQSSGIIILLCKYSIVLSDTLTGSWMCFSGCSLQYYWRVMRHDWVTGRLSYWKKVHKRICLRNITFLAAYPPSCVILPLFLSRASHFFLSKNCCENKEGRSARGRELVPTALSKCLRLCIYKYVT